MTIELRRRFFAEEIEAVGRLRSTRLVDALAAVPREAFFPAGPWTVLAEGDYASGAMGAGIATRLTPDADPSRLYHNIAVAIDPGRQLFNGQPGTLAVFIDALALSPDARVLHIGCGFGYYTAVMAHCVGPSGRVVAFEVDSALAAGARRNLAATPWVDVRDGDASAASGETFDAILVNAGVTHPLEWWLDALAPAGRMILPLTAMMPATGSRIGKGLVFALTRTSAVEFAARVLSLVAIYSAEGLRDESLGARIGAALASGPMKWQAVSRLRRDGHDVSPACWLHGPTYCLSAAVSAPPAASADPDQTGSADAVRPASQ